MVTPKRSYSGQIGACFAQSQLHSSERAISTLREYRDKLDSLAGALLEKEEIPGEEVLESVGVERRKL